MSAWLLRQHKPLRQRLDDAILKYLNRLSDALFVWSRWASHRLGVPETLWEPNQAASQALP